jgi:hypothetical protein
LSNRCKTSSRCDGRIYWTRPVKLLADSRSPGPRRAHQWTDPADPAARRQPSVSAFRHASGSKSRLMSGSNPSLDSQLAHDFGIHANLASGSSTSLGRHAASQLSLHDMPVGGIPPQVIALGQGNGQGQGSAPTSPYGHPLGAAVAHGHGMGRDQAVHSGQGGQGHGHGQAQGQGQHLPSISDWQGGYHAAQINPMFRVVSGFGSEVFVGSSPPALPLDSASTDILSHSFGLHYSVRYSRLRNRRGLTTSGSPPLRTRDRNPPFRHSRQLRASRTPRPRRRRSGRTRDDGADTLVGLTGWTFAPSLLHSTRRPFVPPRGSRFEPTLLGVDQVHATARFPL